MQVEEFLEDSARVFPSKVALICGKSRYTYAEIDAQANRVAVALLEAGVQRGDRVVVLLPNTAETVIALFGILKAGAVFVLLNATTKPDKLMYIVNNCQAVALVVDGAGWAIAQKASDVMPSIGIVLVARCKSDLPTAAGGGRVINFEAVRLGAQRVKAPPKTCIDIDLAALVYTSGTTGHPKGVMLTHLNMVSVATSIATYLENTSDDVVMNFLPLAFGYGLYQVLVMFKVGGTVVLHDSFAFPHVVLDLMERERVTGLPIVPTVAALLLQMDISRYALPQLRYITNAGAALPVEHLRRLRTLFPKAKLYSMYGQTECQRVSYLSPDQLDVRPGSVGRGMPNEEVFIVDEQGHRVGPGVTGELVIRGSHVMRGYWELPEETERRLRPGPLAGEKVLYSGDLFRADEEGYLYFVSRKDDIIKSRGEKVSPKEVEDAICRLEGIAEAAVIGVPDAFLGSAIKAIVKLTPGAHLTAQDILRHCAGHLEDFMRPKYVEFVEAVPKTENGKVSKRLLAERETEMAGASSR
ncbi:class I adenylate-forming enzyme family protein [Occallatibacter riparius]|uniref:Acyl--CoA ligase n=1 Tax=Occallatibacter riparius TaxID=1002689 RepID=A0A9J7BJF4_9BACT|nr:acyl--CoA ligase [Occallatibacter riparius]UWZ81922.1 acyl--CoA ligase [Occallatibacter riparius]